mgnify:CR=1 FL=1
MTDNKKNQIKTATQLKKEILKTIEELTNKVALTETKNPEEVDWAVVGDLGRVSLLVKEANDFFKS